MSILDNTISKPMAQQKVKAQVLSTIKVLYAKMLNDFGSAFGLIWSNPDGLTPAEALESLGTDGKEVFTLAGILKQALNTAKPGSITAANPDVDIAEDGTVTLKAAPASIDK